ncbi:MAG TPA: heterodisulfide reductase-related iron-sulfur binding cluster, partial [Anaerolineales bacterium]|nr:heterodisulfide reductase-related iron-sulfur binding cluster [Anaerolineales bacterium]
EIEISERMTNTWLFDEFLLRSEEFQLLCAVIKTHGAEPSKDSPSQKIKFHPHCHQRAEGPGVDGLPTGTNATVELLHMCGYKVELMDTGCCGMAGTFGYEAEHYDLSMNVAELKLFPLLRAESGTGNVNPPVVSSGAACRMQIRQGTGIQALHPIMLVNQFLDEGIANDEK